jgi:hypothetical protein
MRSILLVLVLISGLSSFASTECLDFPSDQKENIYTAIATRRGWTPTIQQQVNGELQYLENGSPLMITNPEDKALVVRKAVIKFIMDEVKAYEVDKAKQAAAAAVEAQLSGVNLQ